MKITLNREVGTLLLDIKGETEMSITKVLQEALMMYQERLKAEKQDASDHSFEGGIVFGNV